MKDTSRHFSDASNFNYSIVNVYRPEQFDVRGYLKERGVASHHRQYKERKNHETKYYDVISSFDIETTADEETAQAFMYVWMWSFDNNVVIGRTWEQFTEFIGEIELADEAVLPVFVHNLSYEFHFLRGILEFDEVFAVRKRKILKAYAGSLEFRCSYFLTHLSLAKLCEKYNVRHSKSNMDYTLYRTPTTTLTKDEETYIINDVIGLNEALRAQMATWGDDIYSIPTTQTGYVRREVKKRLNMKKVHIAKWIPDYDTYVELLAAFRGGNTHAHRNHAGKIWRNVSSADIASSYPAQMLFKKFPMGAFRHYSQKMGNLSDTLLAGLLANKNTALLMRVRFYNIECDSHYGVPYLSIHKCISTNVIEDNGRILYATFCETVITDIDYECILGHYKYEAIEITDVYASTYGYLYKELTDFIKELFKNKTELKGVDDDLYMRSKEMINSCYGLCAERVLHESFELICNKVEEKEIENVLEEYAKQTKNPYKLYAWGVWVTAHARHDLEKMIHHVHDNGTFLYADTDSVKFIGHLDYEVYNKPLIERAKATGAMGVTKKGVEKYCGIWEEEEGYNTFATLGAKKYAYVDQKGKLHITISGVSKISGAHELSDHGGLERFVHAKDESFTFDIAGGTGVTFNDDVDFHIVRNGETIHITPNAYIYEDTATLSVTSEYEKLLNTYEKGE